MLADDFGRLSRMLGGIEGRFVLSLNDRPEVREIFADFFIETVRLRYTMGPGQYRGLDHNRVATELLISNDAARSAPPDAARILPAHRGHPRLPGF